MSLPKLVLLSVAWVFASITIGVVAGVFLTEILVLAGVVDTGTSEYSASLNMITFSVFAVVVVVPFVFRTRFRSGEPEDE
ncbi:MAG: hypothetical protein ABFR53_10360 [Actinomycetota bacterium]